MPAINKITAAKAINPESPITAIRTSYNSFAFIFSNFHLLYYFFFLSFNFFILISLVIYKSIYLKVLI